MTVTIGGVSINSTFVNGRTGERTNSTDWELPDRLSRFVDLSNRACITLAVTRVVGESWGEILTPEDFTRAIAVVRNIEGRFPFTKIRFGNADARKTPIAAQNVSFPLLAAADTGQVSVIPHRGYLLGVDHRLGRAEALVRVGRDEEWDPSQLTSLLEGTLALCAPDFGALMLHAASLVVDGVGYLFVGNSGAGKSTIAGRVDPGSVLSDDGSWCERKDDSFLLCPTPFTQTDSTAAAGSGYPLGRILFLEKGAQNRIDGLSPGRAMTMLLSNYIHFFRFMGREQAAAAFGLVGELCRRHAASKLIFTRDFNPEPFFRRVTDETRKAV